MQTIRSTLFHKIAPSGPGTTGPRPALILLHGRGANEDDLLGLTPYLDPRFLVIAVRAPLDFGYGGYTWYDMQTIGSPHREQFTESYGKLVQFLDDVRTGYPVDAARLALLGFSMGAVMAYACLLTRPDLVHSIVAHSGYIPEGTGLDLRYTLDGKGVFVAHGTADPVIGIEFARRARELLTPAGADLTYREYPIPHSMSEESVADLSAWLRDRIFGAEA